MGDVSAKDGSQETLVNLAAVLFSLGLTPVLADAAPAVTWALFLAFTALHLWANYRAVSVLCLDTFNRRRAHLAMADWLAHGAVPSPAVIATREPLFQCTRINAGLAPGGFPRVLGW